MSEEDKRTLMYGAYMHDIGKINIDKNVLMKTGKLTDEEWAALKRHPVDGANVIQNIDSLKSVMPLILQHHERYDGRGYPYGLKGEEIDPLARILSVADSFDAMTSTDPISPGRPMRKPTPSCGAARDPVRPEIAISFIHIIQNYLRHSAVIPSAPERLLEKLDEA